MNTEQYLKEEFQVYPSSFRDVSNYMVKVEHKNNVIFPLSYLQSVGLGFIAEHISIESKNDLYIATINGLSSLPQKTDYLAVWELLSMKKCPTVVFSPAIKSGLTSKKEDIVSVFTSVKWLADIDFLITIWKQHKKTKNFSLLIEDDHHFIEAIGLVYRVLRKSIAEKLKEMNFELSNTDDLTTFAKAQSATRHDRLKYYPRFKDQLSDDFRTKILKLINL